MSKKQNLNNLVFECPRRQSEQEILVLEEEGYQHHLVLHNDDVHTFDFVIESLIDICHHSWEQAEQCTMLVHYKGKCRVKTGDMELLKPMHQKLIKRGLTSEIV